jgi:hypothetical protein
MSSSNYLRWLLHYSCATHARRAYYQPVLVSELTGDAKDFGDITGRKRDAERAVTRLNRAREHAKG